MKTMLDDLNRVPGVEGCLVCDRKGKVLAEACPPDVGGAALLEAATALATGASELEGVAGTLSLIELHHSRRRMVARPIDGGTLLLVCEKDANPRQLLAAVAEVIERHGEGRGAALPAPRVARAASAPAPDPAGIPRRTLLASGVGAAVVLIGVAVYAIVGRPQAGPAPVKPAPVEAAEVLLRIGGAKAFAVELAPALARSYLESMNVQEVKVEKESATRFRVRGKKEGGGLVAIAVEGLPTAQGFDELAAGRLDVAMAGRRIRPEWQQKLKAFGPMTAPGYEHVVALSGIAVIVHPSNPVAQLDREQLAAIFGGAVVDWTRVGGKARRGAGTAIHVYAGDEQMGLTDLFRTLVLGKGAYAADAKRLTNVAAVNDAVAQDPQGIGYVTLPFVRGTRAVPIAEGAERPHLPTPFTLASEDYFLTHRLYFYTVPRPENPHLLKFIQHALGAEGQAVVKKSGYVELSVTTIQGDVPASAPADYRRVVAGARRLTSTFRFETDSAIFDTRALVDLERVTAYLAEQRLNGAAVKVLGFTDSQGRADRNLELSRSRAEQVEQALAQRGIEGVTVSGFGAAMPVASNEGAEGRQRNRRVEIWVAR